MKRNVMLTPMVEKSALAIRRWAVRTTGEPSSADGKTWSVPHCLPHCLSPIVSLAGTLLGDELEGNEGDTNMRLQITWKSRRWRHADFALTAINDSIWMRVA